MKKVLENFSEVNILQQDNVRNNTFAELIGNKQDFVSYGQNNDFPSYLWDLYLSSPTHQACIQAKHNYVMGQGIKGGDMEVNRRGETLDEIMSKASLDLLIYGGFSLQLIFDRNNEIAEIYFVDFGKLRLTPNEDKVLFSNNWKRWQNKYQTLDLFDSKAKDRKTQIFYYRDPSARGFYPIPSYSAALEAINTDKAIQTYHNNNIKNGFAANFILNFNSGVPSQEKREEIEKKVYQKFCGEKSSGNLLISWNKDDKSGVEVKTIDEADFDKKYLALSENTQNNIIIAHEVVSKCLIGGTTAGKGFSIEEFGESFEVFSKTIIQPIQKNVQRALKKILGKDIEFIPFEIEQVQKYKQGMEE